MLALPSKTAFFDPFDSSTYTAHAPLYSGGPNLRQRPRGGFPAIQDHTCRSSTPHHLETKIKKSLAALQRGLPKVGEKLLLKNVSRYRY
jgi:hypothetical protein